MRRNIRVSDSVRHAQAQGLARRIQSAAELRIRHRAYLWPGDKSNGSAFRSMVTWKAFVEASGQSFDDLETENIDC